jgi:hypothetical protein
MRKMQARENAAVPEGRRRTFGPNNQSQLRHRKRKHERDAQNRIRAPRWGHQVTDFDSAKLALRAQARHGWARTW